MSEPKVKKISVFAKMSAVLFVLLGGVMGAMLAPFTAEKAVAFLEGPSEVTVEAMINEKVMLDITSPYSYFCFSGFLNENLIVLRMDCTSLTGKTPRDVFLFKDKFPYQLKIEGGVVNVDLIDSSHQHVKLHFSLPKVVKADN